MKDLLDRVKNCNLFSLSAELKQEYVSEEEGKRALCNIQKMHKEELRKLYNRFALHYQLDPFEKIYTTIQNECLQFEKDYKREYMETYGFFQCSFFADLVGEETKYNEPQDLFYHFYSALSHERDMEHSLENLYEQLWDEKPLDILEQEMYSSIKPYLTRYEISFMTPCTEGPLVKNLFFQCNERTKSWLSQFSSEFEIPGELQDLAFYKDDTLVYSCCTHEHSSSFVEE